MNPQSLPPSRRDFSSRREHLIYRLDQQARFTRRFELRHLLGGLAMQASGMSYILYADEGSVLVLSAINLLVNGFPILLQRYNRIRVVVALARIEQPPGAS